MPMWTPECVIVFGPALRACTATVIPRLATRVCGTTGRERGFCTLRQSTRSVQCPKWHSRLWVAAVVGARATGQGSGGHYC